MRTAVHLLLSLCLLAPSTRAADEADQRPPIQLSEEDFIRLSREPWTVVLDTSAPETYRWLHVAGALHLTREEMNAASLAQIIPDKDTRVLLYENNHYHAYEKARATGRTNEMGVPFAGDWSGDAFMDSLTLREHGYHRLYALASYVRIDRGSLPLVADADGVDLGRPLVMSLGTTGHAHL